jgi:uncharacterized protein involved in outer membrane biogenesis
MRVLLKILLGVAAVLVLLVAAVAIIVATIDTRTLLTPLEAQLEQATGRDIAVNGNARITPSLTPTLVLEDVTIGNASWGSAKEMLRAKRVEAQVALLPLLSRRVDIVRFTLVEPSILLETDKAGRGNWTFGETTARTPPSDPVADAGGAFALGEFAVEKGELRWRDGRTGAVTPIRIDKLYLRGREPGKPVVAEFAGTIDGVPLALEGHFGPLEALRAKQSPWPVSLKGEVAGQKAKVETKLREAKDGIEASDLALDFGTLRMRGTLTYATRNDRPHVVFDLAADSLSPSDLAFAGAAVARSPSAQAPPPMSDGRIFPGTPLPLAGLRAFDGQGSLAIGKLVLGDKRTLTNVRAKLALAGGRLDVSDFAAGVHGGQASGRLSLDASSEKSAAVTLRLDGRDLDLALLMAALGVPREISGGKTQIAVDINARGDSLRAWASSLGGTTTVRVGPARWAKSNAGLSDSLLQAVNALDPFRASSSTADLNCAVVRLPFASGIAKVNRGIGVETDRLGLSASGTVDLRSETLDLTLAPRVKSGAGVDLAKLAGAVRLRGPLASPGVVIDPAGSIAAAAQIGALAQGGRAALLAGVLGGGGSSSSGPGECAVALGAAAAPASGTSARGRQPQPAPENQAAKEVERALGKLLGR